jgi:hypothetical protein
MIFHTGNTFQSQFCYQKSELTEVQEYTFLGNTIDRKGRFKRSTQELSKKEPKTFFSLKKYMSNFQHVPVDLLCKLFDSLIRPIILYNSEIWFMEEYVSVFKAKNRARIHGTSCDILSLIDRFSMEKVHHKFCKSVLGMGENFQQHCCKIRARSIAT